MQHICLYHTLNICETIERPSLTCNVDENEWMNGEGGVKYMEEEVWKGRGLIPAILALTRENPK